jgi:beta-galactosidase
MGLAVKRWRWLIPVLMLTIGCSGSPDPAAVARRTDAIKGPADGPLAPTLEFRPARLTGEGGPASLPVAWQAGLPVPGFDPQDRPRLNLAGTWRKERVKVDHNLSLGTRGGDGLARIEAEGQGRHKADYDDSQWATITLPAVENRMPKLVGDPEGPEPYENGVWYRRKFTVPKDWKGRLITLQFLSVNYVADVWINGIWVGYHEGGYTPFALDVTDALHYGGENVIAVRVDNPPWGTRLDTIPGPKVDWWNYTGIIHDLYLEAAPAVRVVRVDAKPLDVTGRVQLTAVVHNAADKQARTQLRLRVRTADPSKPGWLTDPRAAAIAGDPVTEPVTVTLDPAANEAVAARVTVQVPNPRLWSPESPNLYVVEAELLSGDQVVDRWLSQFGIRTIGTEKAKLLLNGKPIFLRGLARHEEWPDTGRTATWERILPDLEQVIAMGANFLRTAHYPNHIYTYLLTDRLGLATWVEVPAWQFTDAEFNVQERRRIADQMWREMILMGANRPSIWFWSTNNESIFSQRRVDYNTRLAQDWKTHFDDGRLLSQSAAADRGGPTDASMAPLDVPAWTLYFGIFHGSTYYAGTRDFLAKAHQAWPDRPLLDTEFGIWSRGGGSSPETQVEVFNETYRAFREVVTVEPDGTVNPDGFLTGITWWTIFDWYTAHTKLQTMGLYHMDRKTAKPVAELVKNAYQQWNRR